MILGDPHFDTRFAGAGIGIPSLPAPPKPPARKRSKIVPVDAAKQRRRKGKSSPPPSRPTADADDENGETWHLALLRCCKLGV